MRIVIDLQGAQTESRFRGIGRYSLSLAKAIARNAGEHEIWLALNGAFGESVLSLRDEFRDLIPQERIRVFEVPLPVAEHDPANSNRARVAEIIREYFLEQLNPDVVLVTSLFEGFVDDAVTSVGRFAKSYQTYVTLHDLIPLINKDIYLKNKNFEKYYIEKLENFKKADFLLSVSNSSKHEAVDYIDFNPEKICTVYNAVDETFTPANLSTDEKDALFAKYGITKKMVMYAPGGFDIRKNFENIIIAFSKLPNKIRDTHQLVIVSKVQDGDRQNLENIAKKAGLEKDELIITGYVSDEELIALYSTCTLFVFPSLHEGFGLPVLEAMACGAPVIGSNTTSVPEVIGYEKALFDPKSVDSISDKIREALENEPFLKELQGHASQQCKKFSWDESAKKAIEVMEKNATSTNMSKHTFQDLIEKLAELVMNYSEEELKNLSVCLANNQTQQKFYSELPSKLNWKIEGPFDSSYSLAMVNKEISLALDMLGHTVILHSTEGHGDFEPNQEFLESHPKIKDMYLNSKNDDLVHSINSRNLYPPRVHDMKCVINLLHNYAWEETGYPSEWIEQFNKHLDGIACTSEYVKKIFIDNGYMGLLSVMFNGADHWLRIKPDSTHLIQAKKFKFLHVSSCFPRKGADILLKSYGESFTQEDDVSLIIKTFKNPHNEIHTWLAEAQAMYASYPDVIIIEEDLSDEKLKALYEQCDCLVGPSRAEGFGLPFAEAMLSGLPVITTGWGGQLDFCTDETAWLIDYEFVPAKTHFELFNSVWAEPSMKHLSQLMLEVYQLPQDLREEKSHNGKKLLLDKFKWSDAAQRLVNFARSFSTQKAVTPKIGWVSTWNTKCGIATYSEHLINAMYDDVIIFGQYADSLMKDEMPNVDRCWQIGEDDDLSLLNENIVKYNINTLVVQFNYGFFNFDAFINFIEHMSNRGIKVVVMMHATTDPKHVPEKKLANLVPSLKKCERLLVHSPADLNRLKTYGLVDNVALFPHGLLDWSPKETVAKNSTFVVSSYGFFLPHKGLLELIESVRLLLDKGLNIKLRMINAQYPVPESEQMVEKARKLISEYKLEQNIELISDFLSDEQCLEELHKADLIVFPYQETGESSSAAVRYGLASKKPVAVAPLAIFDDVSGAVYELPGCRIDDIAKGIEDIMKKITEETEEAKAMNEKASKWREAHSYSKVGYRLNNILNSVLRNC